MTKRATLHFKVTSYADGTPWIVIEPFSGGDLALFQKTIGFDLLQERRSTVIGGIR
jgi:hypothetical protein